jgi:hypothetical protein
MTDYFVDFDGIRNDYFQFIKQGGCFFIGASVTAQKNGWADRLVELISERLGSSFTVNKKAMGGVGLLFGVTNWPSLRLPVGGVVFIEFSINDLNLGLTPLAHLETLLKALIIDILKNKSLPIIVHNWRADFRQEKGDLVRNIYNVIASQFQIIPVIRNDLFIESEIARNPRTEEMWFRDICHTTSEGSSAYAKHIFNVISVMSQDNKSCSIQVNNFEKELGDIEPILDLNRYLNCSKYVKRIYVYPNTGQEFAYYDCDASVEFEAVASGELMGIAFISGPTSGWVELLIDNEVKQKFRCFDRHSYYERFILLPAFYKLSNNLVKIRLSADPIDFTIAKQENSAFKEQRRMQLVSMVGVELTFNLAITLYQNQDENSS